MAFTGYVFESAETISPYLEEPRTGPSSLFCREVAIHLGCYVAGGYPERLSEEERLVESQADRSIRFPVGGMDIETTSDVDTLSATPVGANSAIIYGPSGEWVGGYRKTNLYETDKTWAKPGTGFTSFSLTPPSISRTESGEVPTSNLLKMTIGICMDLNPFPSCHQTTVEWPCELADYCVKSKSDLLVLLNAWLDPSLDDDRDENAEDGTLDSTDDSSAEDNEVIDAEGTEPSWHTLRYWAARLHPLFERDWRRRGSTETIVSNSSTDEHEKAKEGREIVEEVNDEQGEKPPHTTIVVVCNRTGTENGTTFAGSSTIFNMRAGSGRARILDVMGKNEEGIRVWDLYL
ncbi:hypothetical protein C0993_011788 [Termitomyces sp. T159_Od127]|nr:hypothetical protein C0993_011788 [Termitomyces sp. T159_Od127]